MTRGNNEILSVKEKEKEHSLKGRVTAKSCDPCAKLETTFQETLDKLVAAEPEAVDNSRRHKMQLSF